MNKDDLAALLVDAPAQEVDQIHRLLHEWSVGPDDSFPVQLALLTKAQWRVAASLPRTLNDSRKWIEAHLADHRRQTKAMLDDSSSTARQQTAEMKAAVEFQAKKAQQSAEQIQMRFDQAEAVAQRVKLLMDHAVAEWKSIKVSTAEQCERLKNVSDELEDRFAWRVLLRSGVWFLLALGYGIAIGRHWTR